MPDLDIPGVTLCCFFTVVYCNPNCLVASSAATSDQYLLTGWPSSFKYLIWTVFALPSWILWSSPILPGW